MTEPIKCPEGMVYIPAGAFKMGSTNGRPDEQPVRDVFESGLCMDKHEVTNAEYSAYTTSPSLRGFDGPDQPVVNVSWFDADAFCRSQDKRLPTEAEWEKAARGPEGYEYGTRSGELNHSESHYDAKATADVCSYPENGYGLCDMAGNVWEWMADWYDRDHYSSMESRDPNGPPDGIEKVLRGGSWSRYDRNPSYLRAAFRYYSGQLDNGSYVVGFRCVTDPLPSEE